MKLSDIAITEKFKVMHKSEICAHFMDEDRTCAIGCKAEQVKQDGKCPFEEAVQRTCICFDPSK